MATTTTQKQEILMNRLGVLLSHDFGYIWGERESGPNGEKKEFLDKGKRFLTQLGKDLVFTDMEVTKNPAGIAVSGEVTLMGMWSEGNGLYVQLMSPIIDNCTVLYRHISHLQDYRGGKNNFLLNIRLQNGDYRELIRTLQLLNQQDAEVPHGTAA